MGVPLSPAAPSPPGGAGPRPSEAGQVWAAQSAAAEMWPVKARPAEGRDGPQASWRKRGGGGGGMGGFKQGCHLILHFGKSLLVAIWRTEGGHLHVGRPGESFRDLLEI